MGSNVNQIRSLLNRPKAYYNIDGVGELGVGLMCLAYGLLSWLQVSSPQHSIWNQMYSLFIFMGIVVAIIHYGSKAVKKHVTYPRTGFVEYQKRDTVWRPMIIGAVVSAVTSLGFGMSIRKHWNLTTPVSLIGLLFAATYAYGIARTVRWKWLVAWAMALGSVIIAVLPADVIGAMASHSWITRQVPAKAVGAFTFTMMLYGALTLISGGISFWLYLRHTQAPAHQSQ